VSGSSEEEFDLLFSSSLLMRMMDEVSVSSVDRSASFRSYNLTSVFVWAGRGTRIYLIRR
jgi:hypothetical protein